MEAGLRVRRVLDVDLLWRRYGQLVVVGAAPVVIVIAGPGRRVDDDAHVQPDVLEIAVRVEVMIEVDIPGHSQDRLLPR